MCPPIIKDFMKTIAKKVGTIFGVNVLIDATILLWLIVPLFSSSSTLFGLSVILISFISVLIHEFAHVLVGRRYGIEPKEVVMSCFGGAALYEETTFMTISPKEEIAISIAGPLANFAICFLGFPFLLFEATTTPAAYIVTINFILGVFNLFPIYPMDGGRIAKSILILFCKDYKLTTYWISGLTACVASFVFGWAIMNGAPLTALIMVMIGLHVYIDLKYIHENAARYTNIQRLKQTFNNDNKATLQYMKDWL